jgi:subfamily B ATP-binding cassette protein MsbA
MVALERVCVFLLVAFLIRNLADYAQSVLMVQVEQATLRDIRSDLYRHLQALSLDFYHGRRAGALISRLTNDVDYLRAALVAATSNILKDGLSLVGYLLWAFYASWSLTLLAMLVLPPLGWALATIGRRIRRRSDRAQERMGDLTSLLQENVTGARVVRAFGMEGFETARFDTANRRYCEAYVRMRRIAALARPVSEYALVVVAVGLMWYVGHAIFEQRTLAPQQFLQFVAALLAMMSPIKSLSEANANVQQGVAAANRLFEVLDTPVTVSERPGAPALPRFSDRVRYEDVSFAYHGGDTVLHGLTFEIRRGEVVALVGSSGAGKSTTMDLLARFYDPTGGAIRVDHHDLRDVTLSSLRSQLGIVTQETILFHETVRNNIAYGLADVPQAEVEAAARAANAHDFVMRLPQGYETVIGDRGTRLSGGERQRLAIARALLKNPPLLLLDEATSALDAESERLVQAALERLMKDRTVLVIAHRLSTVQHADRIVVLERGRVVDVGSHAELMAREGPYRRLHALQFGG